MSAKMGAAKRRAFLRAFAQSGNVTLSAEQAGMSRSWVSLERRREPEFDAAFRLAKAASAERLREGKRNRPPKAWKQRGGVDLVVRRPGKRVPQVVRAPAMGRWTPRTEGRFLGRLSLCNNLKMACAAAGMTLSSYEAHARRWPDFRRRVREARALASLRIGADLAAERRRPFDLSELLAEDLPEPSVEEAFNLVRRHRQGLGR